MILLDTNVVSELMRPAPDPRVVAWLAGQEPASLALSVVTVAEILYGLERLPGGATKMPTRNVSRWPRPRSPLV